MGACFSADDESFDYETELRADRNVRSSDKFAEAKEKEPDCGLPRRHVAFQRALTTHPLGEDLRTLWRAAQRGAAQWPDNPCLGARKWYLNLDGKRQRGEFEWLSYKQVLEEAAHFGKGLAELGLIPGDNVGICSLNRVEWTISMLGLASQSLIIVALYDSLGESAIEYIANHAETKIVIVSKDKIKKLLSVLPKCRCIKHLIQFDPDPRFGSAPDEINEGDVKEAASWGVQLHGFSRIVEMGKRSDRPLMEARPEDLSHIMYTSGTTGTPKGVMLRHLGIMAVAAGQVALVPVSEQDRHFSYLPLAHIFETVVQATLLVSGASIGFYQGDPKKMMEDIKELRPTIMCGVPRVYSKMYDTLVAKVQQEMCIKRLVFMRALIGQSKRVRRGQPIDRGYENLFIKVRTAMGLQDCRGVLTGAAPIPPYVMDFLKVVINPPLGVLQGYGLTETASGGCVTSREDHTLGHVGAPMPSVEIRLRDVPEMGYRHTDEQPRGEIQIRGPPVFVGYYKNEDATREVLSPDGWFSTGDIGRWNPNGTLSIIDRKKNIFKLAQGEYIAVEKLEMTYGKSAWANQLFVYGNSYKTLLVAIVVPRIDTALTFAKQHDWWPHEVKASLSSPELRVEFKRMIEEHRREFNQEVLESLNKAATADNLLGFEKVKAVYLEADLDDSGNGFTVENDCLTPTFKLRRPFLVSRYKEQLQLMYTALGEPPKPDEKW